MGLLLNFLVGGLQIFSRFGISNAVPFSSLHRRTDVVAGLVGSEVDMTSGQGGTYPRANLLADGVTLVGTYTGFSDSDSVITVIKSTDKGSSWEELGTVARGPTNATDIDNPYIIELPSGRLLVAFRNHSKDPTTGKYTFYRITICSSDDGGLTWAWLSQPASDPAPPNGNWEPFLRNALDGNLQIYYSRENSEADQDSLMRTSTDGGVSWSTATVISGTGITSRDGMVGVTTISDSNLIAVFEVEQNNLFTIHYITSPDDGTTWGNRTLLYSPTGTNNNAGSPQIINVGGSLVCSFMTDEDYSDHAWGSQAGVDNKIVVSGDGGGTWGMSTKTTVFPVKAIWPGLVTLDSEDFLVLADHSGAKSQKVTLT